MIKSDVYSTSLYDNTLLQRMGKYSIKKNKSSGFCHCYCLRCDQKWCLTVTPSTITLWKCIVKKQEHMDWSLPLSLSLSFGWLSLWSRVMFTPPPLLFTLLQRIGKRIIRKLNIELSSILNYYSHDEVYNPYRASSMSTPWKCLMNTLACNAILNF